MTEYVKGKKVIKQENGTFDRNMPKEEIGHLLKIGGCQTNKDLQEAYETQ